MRTWVNWGGIYQAKKKGNYNKIDQLRSKTFPSTLLLHTIQLGEQRLNFGNVDHRMTLPKNHFVFHDRNLELGLIYKENYHQNHKKF